MVKKLGLALSGGGFRASFYHIGVLAQMAEQGLLRYVEVISTVSGGSIIGALYYLHLKKLLESKADNEISEQDYVEIVQRIEHDFLTVVAKNIRMETFSSFKANFRMLSSHYSRSDRLAELYNDYLYQAVLPKNSKISNPLQMQQLKIQPFGETIDFSPKQDNEQRKAKVPTIVFNATTLNTGRNWQFTPQTMGEPPERLNYREEQSQQVSDVIDKKTIRLRRAPRYADMVVVKDRNGNEILNQQEIPLGHAVAASACVPGLFHPLSITGLYKDKWLKENQTITPQLVDGGVLDNQGIEALLQNQCDCFVISDAAGQMEVQNEVSTEPLSVLLRVSDILQDKVRSDGLKHLLTRTCQMDTQLNNVAFMDLRQGLAIREIAWIDKDNWQENDKTIPANASEFLVDPQVQQKLALMRTDLDAFTEVEAYSLMLDGYQMSEKRLARFKEGIAYADINQAAHQGKVEWQFKAIAPWLEKPTVDYLKQLEIAKSVPFKALQYFPFKLGIPLALLITGLLYLVYLQIADIFFQSIPVYAIVIFLAASLLFVTLTKLLHSHLRIVKRVAAVAGLLLGTPFFKFYLAWINPLFVARGSLAELKKRDGQA